MVAHRPEVLLEGRSSLPSKYILRCFAKGSGGLGNRHRVHDIGYEDNKHARQTRLDYAAVGCWGLNALVCFAAVWMFLDWQCNGESSLFMRSVASIVTCAPPSPRNAVTSCCSNGLQLHQCRQICCTRSGQHRSSATQEAVTKPKRAERSRLRFVTGPQ